MGFKAAAITATAAGTILLSGLTFSGTVNLADIKNIGWGWAEKVSTAVDQTKEMANKFGLFKADVTALLNEKIAHINSLNAKISDLLAKVGTGEVNLEAANNEIARLNEELTKANEEVEALKNEYGLKDAEVAAAFAEMATAASMDTTLSLDTQNPDVVDTEGSAPTEPTEEPQQEEQQQSAYAAQETAIKAALINRFSKLESVQVTMTDSTITITESDLFSVDMFGTTSKGIIQTAAGVTITGDPIKGSNSFTYNY